VGRLRERSDREGWPAARYLATLLEHELAERYQRRIQRHLQDAHLPAGKSFATFDFAAVPMINKSQITALAAGGSWLDKGANLLAFGPPESNSYCSSLDLLKTQHFLMRIARRRTPKPAGLRCLADLGAIEITRSNDPGRAFAELLSR